MKPTPKHRPQSKWLPDGVPTLDLVLVEGRLVAVIIPSRLSATQMQIARTIAPEFRAFPLLSKRWRVWGVLASDHWGEATQEALDRSTPPRSISMAFASKS